MRQFAIFLVSFLVIVAMGLSYPDIRPKNITFYCCVTVAVTRYWGIRIFTSYVRGKTDFVDTNDGEHGVLDPDVHVRRTHKY